ncbi:MAG TPA: hypothetical protein VM734_00775 [Kofleriaceae bacterium]|nr:hypothetical protein [Kofleriaceae bacterium]
MLRRRITGAGIAEVSLATDLMLDREVAVMSVRAALTAERRHLHRFRHAAHALATVDSPRIAPVFDMVLGPDSCHVITRPGRALAQVIDDAGGLAPPRAARLVGDVLDALAELHRRRRAHGELWATTVLVDGGDRAFILAVGTPGASGYHRDLYQSGMLLLHAVFGRDPAALLPDARAAAIRALPAPLVEVVERALTNDPAQRWPSVGAMKAALDRAVAEPVPELLAEELVELEDRADPDPVAPVARRARVSTAMLAAAAALLAVLPAVTHCALDGTDRGGETPAATALVTAPAPAPWLVGSSAPRWLTADGAVGQQLVTSIRLAGDAWRMITTASPVPPPRARLTTTSSRDTRARTRPRVEAPPPATSRVDAELDRLLEAMPPELLRADPPAGRR